MPKGFTDCEKSGGKIVTKQLKGNRYIRICYDKNGNSHPGEVKTKKKKSKGYWRNNKKANQIKKSKALVSDLRRLKKHFDAKRSE